MSSPNLTLRARTTFALLLAAMAAGCSADDTMDTSADAAPTEVSNAMRDSGPTSGAGDASAADAAPARAYGEFCLDDLDCESKVCFEQRCSAHCDSALANDCRAEQAFCVVTTISDPSCVGHVETGPDVGDDAVLSPDETAIAKLSPLGDADMFQVVLPVGRYAATSQPSADGDIRLEVYDDLTKLEGSADAGGVGAGEFVTFMVRHDAARYHLVVRSVGGSAANATIAIKPLP